MTRYQNDTYNISNKFNTVNKFNREASNMQGGEKMEVKERIKNLGLTQKGFAKLLGYSQNTIYKFLSGNYKSEKLSRKVAEKLENLEKQLKGGEQK